MTNPQPETLPAQAAAPWWKSPIALNLLVTSLVVGVFSTVLGGLILYSIAKTNALSAELAETRADIRVEIAVLKTNQQNLMTNQQDIRANQLDIRANQQKILIELEAHKIELEAHGAELEAHGAELEAHGAELEVHKEEHRQERQERLEAQESSAAATDAQAAAALDSETEANIPNNAETHASRGLQQP